MTELPESITTCTVTFGPAYDFIGESADIALSISVSLNLVHQSTGTQIVSFAVGAVSTEGQQGSIDLPHTDQPGFVDFSGEDRTDWTYTAQGTWTTASGEVKRFSQTFSLPSAFTKVNLDLLPSQAQVP
jgi:hypothetical protein